MSVKAKTKTSGDRVVAPGSLVKHRWQRIDVPPCLVISRSRDDVCHLLEADGSCVVVDLDDMFF